MRESLTLDFCNVSIYDNYMVVVINEGVTVLLKHNNITRGSYHFYRSNDDPIKQASFFTKTVQPYLKADIPLVLDIEQGKRGKKLLFFSTPD